MNQRTASSGRKRGQRRFARSRIVNVRRPFYPSDDAPTLLHVSRGLSGGKSASVHFLENGADSDFSG